MSMKLSHKGYTGSIEASIDDNCLHGRILFIDDIITYEGTTVEDTVVSFKDAVDRYLAYCKETGKPANKPFSGSFNVRIGPELHRKAAEIASIRNTTLNEFVVQSIKAVVENNVVVRHEHTHHLNLKIDRTKISETTVTASTKPLFWETTNAIH